MKFHVEKISCGGCAQTVRRGIAQVDNVARVSVDVASKTVEVETTAPERMIRDALQSVGYSATEAQT